MELVALDLHGELGRWLEVLAAQQDGGMRPLLAHPEATAEGVVLVARLEQLVADGGDAPPRSIEANLRHAILNPRAEGDGLHAVGLQCGCRRDLDAVAGDVKGGHRLFA